MAKTDESVRRGDEGAITGRAPRLGHHLERLLLHLLKWVYQPQERVRRGRSWRTSMLQARQEIAKLIEESPSLHDYPAQQVAGAYRRARAQAAIQTDLPLATFPEAYPWDLAHVLEATFLPEEDRRWTLSPLGRAPTC